LSLAGCGGSDDSSSPSSSASPAVSSALVRLGRATATLEPRDIDDAQGTNYTIADYIKDNNITETPIAAGDPDAPTIDLPIPDGWSPAGEETPEYAYAAIVYTGPDASSADYQPNFVALLSRLEGDVDSPGVASRRTG
jgi:hypothetical protein